MTIKVIILSANNPAGYALWSNQALPDLEARGLVSSGLAQYFDSVAQFGINAQDAARVSTLLAGGGGGAAAVTVANQVANVTLTAATTVDVVAVRYINLAQTTANVTITIPPLTAASTNIIIAFSNTGTVPVTVSGADVFALNAGESREWVWAGASWKLMVVKLTAAQTAAVQGLVAVAGIYDAAKLPRWQAALARYAAGTANPKLLVVSDSTAVGPLATGSAPNAYARNDMSRSWPYQLADLMTARGFRVNKGFVSGDVTNTTVAATVAAHDTRRAFGANWAFNITFQTVGNNCAGNNTAGDQSVMSFTPAEAFDTIEVVYVTNPVYGKFSIAVDGAAPLGAVVDCTPALSVLTATRTCTLGTHRVDIYRSAAMLADGNMPIISIRTYNSTSRTIDILNAGAGGTTTALQSDDSAIYKAGAVLPLYAPDLSIVCIDINDWIGAVTPGTYDLATTTTHAFQLAKLVRKLQVSGDVILMTGVPSKISSYTRAVQDAILQSTRQVAVITGCPVIDISALWGDYVAGTAAGYYLPVADVVHPGSAGYADIAARVMAYPRILG